MHLRALRWRPGCRHTQPRIMMLCRWLDDPLVCPGAIGQRWGPEEARLIRSVLRSDPVFGLQLRTDDDLLPNRTDIWLRNLPRISGYRHERVI